MCGQQPHRLASRASLEQRVRRDLLGGELVDEGDRPATRGAFLVPRRGLEQGDDGIEVAVCGTTVRSAELSGALQPLRPCGGLPQQPQHLMGRGTALHLGPRLAEELPEPPGGAEGEVRLGPRGAVQVDQPLGLRRRPPGSAPHSVSAAGRAPSSRSWARRARPRRRRPEESSPPNGDSNRALATSCVSASGETAARSASRSGATAASRASGSSSPATSTGTPAAPSARCASGIERAPDRTSTAMAPHGVPPSRCSRRRMSATASSWAVAEEYVTTATAPGGVPGPGSSCAVGAKRARQARPTTAAGGRRPWTRPAGRRRPGARRSA